MAKLTNALKRRIVQQLAMFVSPSEIQEALRAEGVTVSAAQVVYYDPKTGSDLSAMWRGLHAATREQFLKESAHIAISHKSYRLQEIGDLYQRAKGKKNFQLASQLLEQAAKEMGESYTNKRVLTGADGRPLVPTPPPPPPSAIAIQLIAPPQYDDE